MQNAAMIIETLQDFGLGQLSHQNRQLPYQPMEVSRKSLRILTKHALPVGDTVAIKSPSGDIAMEVVDHNPYPAMNDHFHISLTSTTDHVDMEKICKTAGCFEEAIRANVSLRALRFEKIPHLEVVASTFGSGAGYHFRVTNVSKTGLMMVPMNTHIIPFKMQTLLEMKIDTHNALSDQMIEVWAQVMRCADRQAPLDQQFFAVQFTEFSDQMTEKWLAIIASLDK